MNGVSVFWTTLTFIIWIKKQVKYSLNNLKRKLYRFWMIWGWVNDDGIFILRQVITLKSKMYICIYIIYITTHIHTHTHTHTHLNSNSSYNWNMIPAHSPTQTLFPFTSTVLHAHSRTYAGSELSSCPWAYGFSEGLSATSLPWSATSSSSDLSTSLPGFELSRTSPKTGPNP